MKIIYIFVGMLLISLIVEKSAQRIQFIDVYLLNEQYYKYYILTLNLILISYLFFILLIFKYRENNNIILLLNKNYRLILLCTYIMAIICLIVGYNAHYIIFLKILKENIIISIFTSIFYMINYYICINLKR